MTNLYCTGDIHGDAISRLSFKKHPALRDLGRNDIMIILGDFGLPFGITMPSYWKHNGEHEWDQYQLNWLANQKYTIVAVAGNHDDYCAINNMPVVPKFGQYVRQMTVGGITYPNIYYIDHADIYNIGGKKCLVIPGANSHDIDDGILDPAQPDFKYRLKEYKKKKKMFRIKNWTWWEQEVPDLFELKIAEKHWVKEHLDFIFTHDCPDLYNKLGMGGFREKSTEFQSFLDKVRLDCDFDSWYHGHKHVNRSYPSFSGDELSLLTEEHQKYYNNSNKINCLYDRIVRLNPYILKYK